MSLCAQNNKEGKIVSYLQSYFTTKHNSINIYIYCLQTLCYLQFIIYI